MILSSIFLLSKVSIKSMLDFRFKRKHLNKARILLLKVTIISKSCLKHKRYLRNTLKRISSWMQHFLRWEASRNLIRGMKNYRSIFKMLRTFWWRILHWTLMSFKTQSISWGTWKLRWVKFQRLLNNSNRRIIQSNSS